MKNKLWGVFLIALVCFCAFFFTYVYNDAKKAAIEDLNEKQMSYARQANIGIDDFFKQWTNLLISISQVDAIANLDNIGKKYMSFTYETNKGDITAITRVDATGKIMFTVPFNPKAIGQDISGYKHIQDVMRFHKPAVSDVFKSVQGFDMVALHVPVLKNGQYRGTLGIGINFQKLAKRYLEGIRIGETGYAWMISRDGKELYCPVPGHTGNSVFENCKDYPAIIAMAEEMIKGKEGMTTYTFNQIRDQKVEQIKKHAVYMPVRIGETFWSIVVASSESEVLSSLERFRNNLILIIGLFLIGGAIFSFLGLRGWFIIREAQKRRQTEEALQKSEQRFRAIFNAAFQFTGLMTPDGTLIVANQAALDFVGIPLEDVVNRPFWETPWWRGNEARARQLQDAITRAAKGEFIRYEVELQGAGDETATVDFSLKPVLDQAGEVALLLPEARDITERKHAEAALQESEERFRRIFYTSPDAININRQEDGLFFDINDGFTRLTGYSQKDITGRTSQEIDIWRHPADRERLMQGLREKGYIENLEADFRMKDGSIATGLMSARVISLNGVPHTLSITRDVSARKRAENAVRESEARLAEIIEFLPDATLVIDRDGKVIAWNKAIEEMTGVRKEEMLGKGNHEYAVPFYGERRSVLIDLVSQPKEEIEKTYRTIRWQGDVLIGEAYLPSLRGKPVYLLNTASPLYDTNGEMVGAIETIRDITGHRRMEEELAAEHDRLAAILDGIPIPAFVIDRNLTVTLWNRNNEIFTGKTKSEMLGKRLDLGFLYQDRIPPSLAELVLEKTDEEIMQKFDSRGIQRSDVFPGAFESSGRIFPRGEERIMSIQAARIYNPQGEVIGAVQTAQDITERIRIQKEQESLQSQLIQAQKMEAIGTLAGGIAHDFNNILTAIMGYTELYKDEVRDQPKIHHSMEQVLRAANRAKDLVTQILTFSRKADREKVPVLLTPIIKEAVKFLRASLPATIEIKQKLEAAYDIIMADPTQMHQVLMNLVTNAGHAMKGTDGVLEIGLREVVMDGANLIRHPTLKFGRYLELSVQDTGYGISRENLGRIFEPYFTTKEKGEGTGLGLAVVHGIVKDHDGEIRVYSELGRGTIFRVYLPLLENQMPDEHDRDETVLRGKGETILFVDDEKMVVDLSKEALEKLGYRVVAETDPVKAIEVFKEDRDAFDLVITDKTMPHMTGFDVAREIRNIRVDIPIILCSGIQERGDLEKLAPLAISRLITKPAKMRDLAKVIHDVLDKQDL